MSVDATSEQAADLNRFGDDQVAKLKSDGKIERCMSTLKKMLMINDRQKNIIKVKNGLAKKMKSFEKIRVIRNFWKLV